MVVQGAMAASMMSSAAVASISAQSATTMVSPFTGLKSAVTFPTTKKPTQDITSITNNGGRVQCMKVQ